MQVPLQVSFRGMEPSAAVEDNVREHAAKLETFFERITSCRVVVEASHHHHHQGNLYHARIDIRVPGAELVVSREPGERKAHEDVYVAIRDAFDAARRQLENHARRARGDVKAHEAPAHGRVSELVSEEDYGRIESADGRLIYFHRNSVLEGGYDALEVGAEVRFVEEVGERGPQASTVHIVGKHHVQ